MKLGPRTRKRGAIDKILTRKRATVARMLAAPPLPARAAPGGGVAAAIARPCVAAFVTAALPVAIVPGARLAFVSCDADLTQGSYDRLYDVRAAFDADYGLERPRLVAVDFVIDSIQVDRAAQSGADALLFVARLVPRSTLAELLEHARSLGLEAIVEVHATEDLEWVMAGPNPIVAVSVRDRDHGRVEVDRALELGTGLVTRARSIVISPPQDPDVARRLLEAFDCVVDEARSSDGAPR